MRSVKIKQQKQAVIESSIFSSKRTVELSYPDLLNWYTSNVGSFTIQPDGYALFTHKSKLPEMLKNFINIVAVKYNISLKNLEYKCLIWPPYIQTGKFKLVEFNIPTAETQVITRVVGVFGHREKISMGTSVMASASGDILLHSGDIYDFPAGVCCGLNLKFDNKNNYRKPSRSGHRDMNISKSPDKRFLIVLDFYGSTEMIDTIINNTLNGSKSKNLKIDKLLDSLENDVADVEKAEEDDDDDVEEVEILPCGQDDSTEIIPELISMNSVGNNLQPASSEGSVSLSNIILEEPVVCDSITRSCDLEETTA